MLVQQAEFNTAAGTLSRATCSLGTEALRSGLGLRGVDISSTVIVPTPNFSFTTCTYGLSGNGCFRVDQRRWEPLGLHDMGRGKQRTGAGD